VCIEWAGSGFGSSTRGHPWPHFSIVALRFAVCIESGSGFGSSTRGHPWPFHSRDLRKAVCSADVCVIV
jgi:hypothetical protein